MRSSVLLSALILVISAGVREASACQCMSPGPPCQNFFQSDVVFVGTVRSITPVAGVDVLNRLRVEFEDAASSRGVEGTSMTVYTSDGGGSCGFPFKRGERYVVYADRIANRIIATICSRTRHIANGGEDLKFFAMLATPSPGARVFGSVVHWDRNPATGDTRDNGPVSNVVLTLRGPDGSFEARTDEAGRYQLAGLPPGRYELTALPPPLFSTAYLTQRLDLPDPRACFTADFGIRYDSRISGSIADAAGRPLEGAIVEATLSARGGNAVDFEPFTTRTDAAGHFELTEVSPARYVLAVNVPQASDSGILSSTTFHPGTFDRAKATAFDVRAGERVRLENMTLPPLPPSYRIDGTVTFQDGTPAAGAFVTLFDGDGRWKQVSDEVQVGSDGRFSLPVHEGINYVLSGRYMDPLTPQRTRAAGSTSFVGSEEKTKTLDVVLRPVR